MPTQRALGTASAMRANCVPRGTLVVTPVVGRPTVKPASSGLVIMQYNSGTDPGSSLCNHVPAAVPTAITASTLLPTVAAIPLVETSLSTTVRNVAFCAASAVLMPDSACV